MHLHLGGHLAWYVPGKVSDLEIHLDEPIELAALVARLHLPMGEISIVAVNGVAASPDGNIVSDGDRVELYPPIGGG